MKKSLSLAVLCLSVWFCFAAARRPQRGIAAPDWVSNPSAVSAEDGVIARSAQASSREEAEAKAKTEIINSFRSSLPEDLDLCINRSVGLLNNLVFNSENRERILSLRTRIEDDMQGIRFTRYWTPSSRRVHTLAELNRNRTSLAYRTQIAREDALIMDLLRKAVRTDNAWHRFALFYSASALDKYLLQQIEELAVIDPNSRTGLNLQYDSEVLQRQVSEYARQVRMRIIAETDSLSAGIAPPLIVLASYGFSNESSAPLVFTYNISCEQTDSRRRSEYIYSYQFNLAANSGEILFSYLGDMRFSTRKGEMPSEANIISLRHDIEQNLHRVLRENLDSLSLRL